MPCAAAIIPSGGTPQKRRIKPPNRSGALFMPPRFRSYRATDRPALPVHGLAGLLPCFYATRHKARKQPKTTRKETKCIVTAPNTRKRRTNDSHAAERVFLRHAHPQNAHKAPKRPQKHREKAPECRRIVLMQNIGCFLGRGFALPHSGECSDHFFGDQIRGKPSVKFRSIKFRRPLRHRERGARLDTSPRSVLDPAHHRAGLTARQRCRSDRGIRSDFCR